MQANKKIVMVTHSARPYANQVQCFSTVTVGRGSQSVSGEGCSPGRPGGAGAAGGDPRRAPVTSAAAAATSDVCYCKTLSVCNRTRRGYERTLISHQDTNSLSLTTFYIGIKVQW